MKKIAVIDSGIGGVTVVKEIMKQLPQEEILYFGDHLNCPYGEKSDAQIRRYIEAIVNFVRTHDIKALVIACNTATVVSLSDLQRTLPFPVLGVVKPGAKDALSVSKNKKIGILATTKTIESGLYTETIQAMDKHAKVYGQACPELVPLIETAAAKENPSEEVNRVLREYLRPLQQKNIDTLVLGCTHYPLLSGLIQEILGPSVQLINPAIETALSLKAQLEILALPSEAQVPQHLFYTSGDEESFSRNLQSWMNIHIPAQKQTLSW